MLSGKVVLVAAGALLVLAGAYVIVASKRTARSAEWTRGPTRGCNLTERTLEHSHSWAYCFILDLLNIQNEPWVRTYYKCGEDSGECPPAASELYVGMETRSYNYLGAFLAVTTGGALAMLAAYAE
jgi:hypothetical protein